MSHTKYQCLFCDHVFDEAGSRMIHAGHNTMPGTPYDLGGIMAEPPEYDDTCPSCDRTLDLQYCEGECCDDCGETEASCECEEKDNSTEVSD